MVKSGRSFGNSGVLQIPLLLALFGIAIGGLGVWGCLRRWRSHMETQLRLDRCVGTQAQVFRDSLNQLLSTNLAVLGLRASIVAAQLQPELLPPLQLALNLVVTKQEVIRTKWKLESGKWLLMRGCGRRNDQSWPLPRLDFERDLPDQYGPQALKWVGAEDPQFYFQVRSSPRAAAARVEGGCVETGSGCKQWIAVWGAPRKIGPSFY